MKLKEKHERNTPRNNWRSWRAEGVSKIAGIIPSIVDGGQHARRYAHQHESARATTSKCSRPIRSAQEDSWPEVPGVVDVSSSLDQDKTEVRLSGSGQSGGRRAVHGSGGGNARSPGGRKRVPTTYEDQDGDAYDVRVRLPETTGATRPSSDASPSCRTAPTAPGCWCRWATWRSCSWTFRPPDPAAGPAPPGDPVRPTTSGSPWGMPSRPSASVPPRVVDCRPGTPFPGAAKPRTWPRPSATSSSLWPWR